ncbi:MAG TPA: hypothetical protein GXZ90_05415 [Clostridiales bacterium]|nr:hypothetical protein [Clostridiales bacterium]
MVDYKYYRDVYFGEQVEDGNKFNRLEAKAERIVAQHTFGRSEKLKDEKMLELVKITICELIDNLDSPSGELDKLIVRRNLINTGLMYAGF